MLHSCVHSVAESQAVVPAQPHNALSMRYVAVLGRPPGTMPYGGRRHRSEGDHGGQWQWRQASAGRLSRYALKHTAYIL